MITQTMIDILVLLKSDKS